MPEPPSTSVAPSAPGSAGVASGSPVVSGDQLAAAVTASSTPRTSAGSRDHMPSLPRHLVRAESPMTVAGGQISATSSSSPRSSTMSSFAGAAVRRGGGWRQSWNTTATHSAGERSRTLSASSADRESTQAESRYEAAMSDTDSINGVHRDHVTSGTLGGNCTPQRSTSIALSRPSLEMLDADEANPVVDAALSSCSSAEIPGPDDEEMSIWQSAPPPAGTPPGIVRDLPSSGDVASPPISSDRSAPPPWTSAGGTIAGNYDWANFVFAYARGRFDPVRSPWPPSRSTAHPGVQAEIVAEAAVSPKSAASPAVGPDGLELRRPSLSYLPPPMGQPHPLQPSQSSVPFQEGKRRSSGDASSSTDPWPGRAVFQSRTPPPMRRSGGYHHDTASRRSGPDVSHHERSDANVATGREGALDSLPLSELASASTPNMAITLPLLSDSKSSSISKFSSDTSKSVPTMYGDQLLRQSLPRVASDGVRTQDDSVWHWRLSQDDSVDNDLLRQGVPRQSSAGDSSNTKQRARTSQESAHLSMGNMSSRLQSEGEPSASNHTYSSAQSSGHSSSTDIDATRGQAKLQRIAGGLLNDESARVEAAAKQLASQSSTEVRPGPKPVQPLQLDGSHAEPTTWSSAPEGYLHSFNNTLASHGGNRADQDISVQSARHDQGPPHGLEHAIETSTVAGMRRAAKRATSRRDSHSAGKRRQEKPNHSQSYHAGEARTRILDVEEATVTGETLPQVNAAPEMRSNFSRSRSDSLRASPQGARQPSEADRWNEAAAEASACPMPAAPWVSDSKGSAPMSRRASEVRRASEDFQAAAAILAEQKNPQGSGVAPYLHAYYNVGRRVEDFYRINGYLPAIMPPNDVDRRGALRRYGPPKVSSDANFDRVAHLVKLVFNTKLVLVSLVGESTQHFRTQAGTAGASRSPAWLQSIASSRNCSFCAHAILQDSDEPFVVLDALKDWRFAGNPLVVGEPYIRFYAGSPLRTADGYNLGSLCIIDDKPWTEFNPRQRHTLREFARVVMREMELSRDTIHLRIRDRMQHSIETFTRECLEMESNESANGEESPGMHQVYAFAAKGMREALQASGAIVFDLSHFELVDAPAFEGDAPSSKIFFPSPYQNPDAAPYASFDDPSTIEGVLETDGVPSAGGADELKQKAVPPMAVLGSSESSPPPSRRDAPVPLAHYIKVAEFLRHHRTGCYYSFAPVPFRHLLPEGMTNLLLVPIFGLNKQPFALLCAYSKSTGDGPQLQDIKESGLQYLRAMGTIILSAILKKDIMLADKAKSNFISNISHELRTPLHGILAAAELLAETKINATQGSYLETVEACGKSLLELVNHVLDFTKLSGNTHAKQSSAKPTQRCDLVKLVQEVCESSWIGQMARKLESSQSSGIGSAYAQGSGGSSNSGTTQSLGHGLAHAAVETVIDITCRPQGWLVKCDAAGIRRVLMNLIGNSLKFTSEGFVHVSLREVQSSETHVVVELGVTDTGKGISRAFLEEQLFHPFTQENHLGPGTGLGLSIVNSIVQSPSINGKIDVWSTQGQGTEMRVTCELEIAHAADAEGLIYRPALDVGKETSISLLGFDRASRGHNDLLEVLRSYTEDWWKFKLVPTGGDIVIVNEDFSILEQLSHRKSPQSGWLPPAILLTSVRGDAEATAACDQYHKAGGVARLLFKPAGPAKLEALVDFSLQCLERARRGEPLLRDSEKHDMVLPSPAQSPHRKPELERESSYFSNATATPRGESSGPHRSTASRSDDLTPGAYENHMSPLPPLDNEASTLLRRHSDHDRIQKVSPTSEKGSNPRPLMPPRSITFNEPRLQRHVHMSPHHPHNASKRRDSSESSDYFGAGATAASAASDRSSAASHPATSSPSSPGSVISLEGGDGAVLKTALHSARIVQNSHIRRRMRVLTIEDNAINRRVLAAFLGKLDVDFVEASNGEEGVRVFESYPPHHFDVILMDLSMPVLDGIGATTQIRKIESERARAAQQVGATSAPSAWRSHAGPSGSRTPAGTPGALRAASRAKIFAITGHSGEDNKRKAFSYGFDGFIVKPMSQRILASLLRMLSNE
ncbi:two-component sensor molecule [Ceraceosorus bombacis]|uniref:histidine kinase n=1 Tax=Ceraceosorus bombacis TaxID=401625 RepID=A0A0P1BPD0_9BASI|nr:two-component sensor molecule [Ceraceosorus bombacis]